MPMKKKKKNLSSSTVFIICIVIGAVAGMVYGGFDRDDYYVWPIIGTSLSIVLTSIVMSFVEERRKKKAKSEKERQRQEELENLDTEKLDNIIAEIKLRTETRAYRLKEEKCDSLALTDSKFGGLPYWPKNREYPENKDGGKLVLLAQINFDKEKLHDRRLPKCGMLQFFIAGDDYSGADFEDPTNQNNFRVVYHSEVDYSVTEENVRALGVKATTDFDFKDSYLPSTEQSGLSFEEFTDYMSVTVEKFNKVVDDIMHDCYGEELEGGSVWKAFNYTEFDYLTKPFDNFGHKMLGYPAFTQCDPRADGEYEILLLQIDSSGSFMWGDCGVANFFINEKDLKKLDFSDILYTWDCY